MGQLYKGIIGKLPFNGHFPIIILSNSMVKKSGSHNMTMIYPSVIKGLFCAYGKGDQQKLK